MLPKFLVMTTVLTCALAAPIKPRFPQTICESDINGVDDSNLVCEDIESSVATITPIGGGPGKRQNTVAGTVTAAGNAADNAGGTAAGAVEGIAGTAGNDVDNGVGTVSAAVNSGLGTTGKTVEGAEGGSG